MCPTTELSIRIKADVLESSCHRDLLRRGIIAKKIIIDRGSREVGEPIAVADEASREVRRVHRSVEVDVATHVERKAASIVRVDADAARRAHKELVIRRAV